ncbi:MAG TPA: NAD(P)-dependent alcohol dehydrogenase [Polyangiaceae bacterium]|nr:NAD(P)-dependent alcohol dehydrogenase [Polyangiaceae bacterium]
MRTYELRGKGLDTLTLIERPVPRPGPGQVLVRMHAASLNYRDLLVATGRYGRGELRYPLVPLSDGAGEVVDIGPGVTRLRPKDRVAGAFFQKWIDGPFDSTKAASALGGAIDGVLSEYVVLEEEGALKFPPSLSYEEASTLPCAGVTAWVGLMDLGKLDAGAVVLAMGTGGVSIFALQLAKTMGATVILTSSSDAKLARGKELGADHVINYRSTPDWAAAARELTHGRGVDSLLEVGGADTLPTSLRSVREGGHLVLVGLLTGKMGDRDEARRNSRGVRVDSVYVGSARHFEHMNEAIARSGLQPVIDRTFPFESAARAYRHLESGAHFGKVVITL